MNGLELSRGILILVAIEALLLVAGWLRLAFTASRSDLAGQGMAQAYAIIGSIVALLLLGAAAALAWQGKLSWLALGLALLAAVFVLIVLVSA
ncbi:hypothetical protein D0B54_11880 [Solimonas sp. K1W22B-7]|uniref:hypothetical protein n=1 Tax=Solimonas sp. K1W22B-7 TaxID=2303331 RepID=UPI000E32D835|nr:hypothetical protein [Solimonas sp. K1W22B-7]AXQ29348.1 hypothetical protein D0B54_11880 [Solimonas sp. K1W22B-7]